jgi:hypothetical protein
VGECPVLEAQVSNTLEHGRVVRDQGDPERPRMRGDEEVIGADRRSASLQVGADPGVVGCRLLVERHGLDVAQERREGRGVVRAPGRYLNAV